MVLQITSIFFLFIAALICSYYWFLAVYALISRSKSQNPFSEGSAHTFAVIIPAHNEEKVIAETLQSCADLDYPKDKYTVYVIADNCSDNTAKISRNMGAACFEREDKENIGKGFALAWAFERILPYGHDALIILDADCFLDTHALRVFDQNLVHGYTVLQANDVASNPDVSPMSYAVAVGNFIENNLFYYPKSALGLAVFLRGTGFVLHRDILTKYPWNAHSIAEDMEYTINLIKNKIRIRFITEVKAASKFPDEKNQLYVQRTRWAGGNLGFGKKHALKMIWQGLIKRQWQVADAGWTFIVLSKPLVLLELITTAIFALLCTWIVPGHFSTTLLFIVLILLVLQALYFAIGITLLGITKRRLSLLVRTPFAVIRLMAISLVNMFSSEKRDWVRTPR